MDMQIPITSFRKAWFGMSEDRLRTSTTPYVDELTVWATPNVLRADDRELRSGR